MREVTVRCEWVSYHVIEVPDDTPRIDSGDLDTLLEVSEDDVTSDLAELYDWDVRDRGPQS